MSAPENKNSTSSSGPLAFRVWLAVLAVFLLWLAVTLAGGPPPREALTEQAPAAPDSTPDPGFVLTDLPPWGSIATPSMPFEAGQEYLLTGYGVQGLWQQPDSAPAWNLFNDGPRLNAQLIRRGESPQVVTENVRITWEADALTELKAEAGQGESASTPRRGDMELSADGLSFSARIPVTPRQSDGLSNPYPVIRLTATDPASGAVLARSAAVLAVSPGFGCAHCHADAGAAILEVHDRHQNTALQVRAAQGGPVDCRICHSGPQPESLKGAATAAAVGMSVSAAVHGWHAQYLGGKGADACLSCHIGLGRSPGDGDDTLRPLFARDLHIERGLNCVSCHGPLEDHALALLKAEKESGQSAAAKAMERLTPRVAADLEAIEPRLPWVQEPSCAGCHDFTAKPRLKDVSGFNHWAEEASALFSGRTEGTGMLRCPSCHGAPHAIYPAKSPIGRERDNIAPMQYQQHARPLGDKGNCALCHMRPMDYSAHHPLVERGSTAVQTPQGAALTMPPARFSHQAHADLDCQGCHHTGREDGKRLYCASALCHDAPKRFDDDGKDAGARYFRSAFHGPTRSCFFCHSERQRQGLPAGPLACKDCHSAPSPRWAEEGAQQTTPGEAAPTPQERPGAEVPRQ